MAQFLLWFHVVQEIVHLKDTFNMMQVKQQACITSLILLIYLRDTARFSQSNSIIPLPEWVEQVCRSNNEHWEQDEIHVYIRIVGN